MLAWPDLRPAIESVGCTYVPFNRTPVFGRAEMLRIRQSSNETIFVRDHVFFESPLSCARDVMDEIDANPADVAAIDVMIPSALCGAEAAGVPCAILMHSVYFHPDSGLPAVGLGSLPAKTFLGRARDALIWSVLERFMAKGMRSLNEARGQLGLGAVSRFADLSGGADRVLVMTSKSFDFEAKKLPPNVRYVGAQLEPGAASGWDSPWSPSDTRPLVLVGLSTDDMGQVPLLRKLIQTLDALDVRALVTTGDQIEPDLFKASDDVAIRRFVPHQDVIPQADLVITHAGHGTVIRALAAGVPLVCIPLGRDQSDVATRVVACGAGQKLRRTAKPAAIQRSITEAMKNARYREAAARISAAISKETEQDLAVRELEALAAERDAS